MRNAREIAREFWLELDQIDAMPSTTIDELAVKADATAALKARFERLPSNMKATIGEIKRNEALPPKEDSALKDVIK